MNRVNQHRARGLSLIEWLVTLSVGAVLMAMAVPGLTHWLQRERLLGGAALMASELQLLRHVAIARNEPLRFSLYPSADGTCTVIHTGEPGLCRCGPRGAATCTVGGTVLSHGHWPIGAGVAVSANVASLRFDPDAGTVTPTGSIRLVDGRGVGITHVVNILGRVRSCSPGGGVPGFAAC